MFSPAKAAQKANVSRKTIMNAIKSMDLKAHRNNENHWIIHEADLAKWMKQRQKKADTVPTGTPTDTITQVPTQIPPSSPTPEVGFQLQLTQQELRHTQDKLENSDREVSRLRSEVQELKEEVREARKQTSEAWSMFSRMTKFLEKPEPVSVPTEKPKVEPFILSPEYRVKPEVTHTRSDFMNVLEKAKNLTEEEDFLENEELDTSSEEFVKENIFDIIDPEEELVVDVQEEKLTDTEKAIKDKYENVRRLLAKSKK